MEKFSRSESLRRACVDRAETFRVGQIKGHAPSNMGQLPFNIKIRPETVARRRKAEVQSFV